MISDEFFPAPSTFEESEQFFSSPVELMSARIGMKCVNYLCTVHTRSPDRWIGPQCHNDLPIGIAMAMAITFELPATKKKKTEKSTLLLSHLIPTPRGLYYNIIKDLLVLPTCQLPMPPPPPEQMKTSKKLLLPRRCILHYEHTC